MTLVSTVKDKLGADIPALAGAVDEVADLAALVTAGALPQRPKAAFVIPLGFDDRGAESASGLFTQAIEDAIGVVLVVQAPGDPKARRALSTVDELKDAVLASLAGWAPADAVGVLVPRRGRLVSVTAGAVIYQVDFALSNQLRIER